MNAIDIKGKLPFAKGGTGECYMIDEETILKLYYENIPEEIVTNEKKCAKKAFVAGIPTAISFQIVKIDNRNGILYERLDASTLSQEIAKHPENIEALGKRYAQIAKAIHGIKGNPNEFERTVDTIYPVVDKIDYIDERKKTNIRNFLREIEKDDTYVHGDFNPNNVMISPEKEPLLIDMGGMTIGNPMFDVASLRFSFFHAGTFADDEINEFTGMTGKQQRELWNIFVKEYFDVNSFEEALEISENARRIDKIAVLKGMVFEDYFGEHMSEEFVERIRESVIHTF